MKRSITVILAGVLAMGGLFVVNEVAEAHQCTAPTQEPAPDKTKKKDTPPPESGEECGPTPVYEDWRPNFVPLFDLPERDEDSKRDAQRWRDEHGCLNQFCVWANPSVSSDDEAGPATLHAGTAGDHSLAEGAHVDDGEEGHGTAEGNHDSHGGSIYADICLGTDEGTSFDGQAGACEDMTDTQVGITVVDHLGCTPGCSDEYHVIRPLDLDYTAKQTSGTARAIEYNTANPDEWLCGYEEHRGPLPCVIAQ